MGHYDEFYEKRYHLQRIEAKKREDDDRKKIRSYVQKRLGVDHSTKLVDLLTETIYNPSYIKDEALR